VPGRRGARGGGGGAGACNRAAGLTVDRRFETNSEFQMDSNQSQIWIKEMKSLPDLKMEKKIVVV
jgi:hypothetical protein